MNQEKQPEALRLAEMIERYNAGCHSQSMIEDYCAAAAEMRRLHALVESQKEEVSSLYGWLAECRDAFSLPAVNTELDHHFCSAMTDPGEVPAYVVAQAKSLEAQLSAIGAGGVERLRKRECLLQSAAPEAFLESPDVQDESGINAHYSRDLMLECIAAALQAAQPAPAGVAAPDAKGREK